MGQYDKTTQNAQPILPLLRKASLFLPKGTIANGYQKRRAAKLSGTPP